MNNTTLTQKQARRIEVQSQMKSLTDEYMPLKYELSDLNDEIEQLEEELQKIDDVQTDATFDKLIESVTGHTILTPEEEEEILNPQRQPKAWSHADDGDIDR